MENWKEAFNIKSKGCEGRTQKPSHLNDGEGVINCPVPFESGCMFLAIVPELDT
jgi:hypothetical protein